MATCLNAQTIRECVSSSRRRKAVMSSNKYRPSKQKPWKTPFASYRVTCACALSSCSSISLADGSPIAICRSGSRFKTRGRSEGLHPGVYGREPGRDKENRQSRRETWVPYYEMARWRLIVNKNHTRLICFADGCVAGAERPTEVLQRKFLRLRWRGGARSDQERTLTALVCVSELNLT